MLKLIGLAYRAKKVAVGTELVLNKVRQKQVFLVMIATDTSQGTKKKVYDKCKTYQVEVMEMFASNEISEAIGKRDIKVLGITDQGFSKALITRGRK
ncbi:MAG: ribosomal L7Ae/L30e/S12e/Gadd45 family protein [Acholeplasmataceae bacterium]